MTDKLIHVEMDCYNHDKPASHRLRAYTLDVTKMRSAYMYPNIRWDDYEVMTFGMLPNLLLRRLITCGTKYNLHHKNELWLPSYGYLPADWPQLTKASKWFNHAAT